MNYDTPTTEHLDARYGAKSAQATAGQGMLNKPTGPLIEAATRIELAIDAIWQLGKKMSAHADMVFGALPESDCVEASPSSSYGGAIGNLFTAIDRLDAAQSYLATQCGRNSGLA